MLFRSSLVGGGEPGEELSGEVRLVEDGLDGGVGMGSRRVDEGFGCEWGSAGDQLEAKNRRTGRNVKNDPVGRVRVACSLEKQNRLSTSRRTRCTPQNSKLGSIRGRGSPRTENMARSSARSLLAGVQNGCSCKSCLPDDSRRSCGGRELRARWWG